MDLTEKNWNWATEIYQSPSFSVGDLIGEDNMFTLHDTIIEYFECLEGSQPKLEDFFYRIKNGIVTHKISLLEAQRILKLNKI